MEIFEASAPQLTSAPMDAQIDTNWYSAAAPVTEIRTRKKSARRAGDGAGVYPARRRIAICLVIVIALTVIIKPLSVTIPVAPAPRGRTTKGRCFGEVPTKRLLAALDLPN